MSSVNLACVATHIPTRKFVGRELQSKVGGEHTNRGVWTRQQLSRAPHRVFDGSVEVGPAQRRRLGRECVEVSRGVQITVMRYYQYVRKYTAT